MSSVSRNENLEVVVRQQVLKEAVLKVEMQKVSDTRLSLQVEIPNTDLKKEIDSIYKSISKSARIPGFRQGNAPRAILEKRYAEEAKGELFKKLIPQAYSKAVEEKQLKPVGHPQLEVTEYKENEVLKFKALLDVQPEVELKNYSGIALKRKNVKVEDKDVEETLTRLQEQHAQYKVVEGRGIQWGDFAIADWVLTQDGKHVEKVDGRWIPVDKDYFIPNFCDSLIGAKAGDKKEIEVILPKDFYKEELREKKGVFNLEVKEVKEKSVPELNNDFAKDLGKFETLDQLKEDVKKQLVEYKDREQENDLKNQVVQHLIKEYKFELPGFLKENLSQEILERAVQQMKMQRMPEKEIEEKKKELIAKAEERAEAEVRIAYLVDAIAKKESIQVEKEDIENHFKNMVQAGQNPAYLENYLKDPQNIEKLRSQLLEEKVLQFLVSQGKIKVE